MTSKLIELAQELWRKLSGYRLIADFIQSVKLRMAEE
jgi:hypothetical protein